MNISFMYPQYLWLLLALPLLFSLSLAGLQHHNRSRFWSSLVLRFFIYLGLVFALSGLQVHLNSRKLTTVFILDASDSLSPEQIARGEQFIKDAVAQMSNNDEAAVVVFGENALIERLPSFEKSLPELASVPVTVRTDIASALQLGQAILPGEGARRIVLLSDGRENIGQAIEQAEISAANQIDLSFFPLGSQNGQAEVYIESLVSPNEIRQGQDFELQADIQSTGTTDAELRIFENNRLIQSLTLRLLPGSNIVPVPIDSENSSSSDPIDGGFLRYRAQILADSDTRLQNNEASAFSIVHGPPPVLIIEKEPEEGINLEHALLAAEMRPKRLLVQEMPTTLEGLAEYDSIVLLGVPAASLPAGVMEILQVYVRDLGKGLVMVGGPESFGAGGYLRTPLEKTLPVDMDVRDKEVQSNLALILAVDKSGSMDRCHCDNPDLNQSYTPQLTGQAKVDIAKEAVMRAAGALGERDYLGVLAFDSQPRWAVELGPLIDPFSLESSISAIQAKGQTNMQAGVLAAYEALQNVQARRKHIILMTDGWVRTGDLNTVAQEMRDQGITLSIVAAGEGSAEYLASLAALGGGEFYPATNIQNVPDIFLKETIQSVGKYIIEEPFYPIPAAPSPVLRGLDVLNLPPLLGYNGTSAKKTARLDLITPQGDPLLASWQYGLGRAAVWTSDLKSQWGSSWITWDGFPRFSAQLIGWTLPAARADNISVEASLKDNHAVIQVDASRPDGNPYNFLSGSVTLVDPGLEVKQIPLKQVAPGSYQAQSNITRPGVYLARVGVNDGDQSLGQETLGLVVPYSPEYKTTGVNISFLERLAQLTGGTRIAVTSEVFKHNLPSIPASREIWLPLLILAALLFPFDVAVRRLSIHKKDWLEALVWVKSIRYVFLRTQVEDQPRLFAGLFDARQRARQKEERLKSPITQPESRKRDSDLSEKSGFPTAKENLDDRLPAQQDQDEPAIENDSLTRLKEAKKRARR